MYTVEYLNAHIIYKWYTLEPLSPLFISAFHAFRSDDWLIHVSWLIYRTTMNINGRLLHGGASAGHNISRGWPEVHNACGQKSSNTKNVARASVARLIFTRTRYICALLLLPVPLFFLSLFNPPSLFWHHPSNEKQYGFICALTMMHEPDGGNTFQVLSL